jgi:hypothetical protein
MGFLSSAFGGGDASDAADAQVQGYQNAIKAYREAESQALANYTPYQNLGSLGANAIANTYASGNFDIFRADPGYQFAFNEGQRAVDSSGAARGLNLSGAQLKGLTKYGQGMADQGYNNWFNRNMNLANYGRGIAGDQANILTNTANQVGAAEAGIGGAKASGYLAKGGIKAGIGNSLLGFGLSKF